MDTPGLEPIKKLIKLVAVLFKSSSKFEFDLISYFSYLSIPKGSCRLFEFIFYSRLLLYLFRKLFYFTVRILMCSLMADTFLLFIYFIRSINLLLNLSSVSIFLADLWYIGNIGSISSSVFNLLILFFIDILLSITILLFFIVFSNFIPSTKLFVPFIFHFLTNYGGFSKNHY